MPTKRNRNRRGGTPETNAERNARLAAVGGSYSKRKGRKIKSRRMSLYGGRKSRKNKSRKNKSRKNKSRRRR